MIWLQAITCFGLWIAYGVVQARRSPRIRARLEAMSRGKKTAMGAILMLSGALVFFLTLLGSYVLHGITPNGMTPLTWIAVALGGLAFVHAQTMAMAMMVSLVHETVTSSPVISSDQQSPTGNQ